MPPVKTNPFFNGQQTAESSSWVTPREITAALGEFDLDPCESTPQPWKHSLRGYTESDNGLSQPWEGRVWLNPPYGRMIEPWIDRMIAHNNGILLCFSRTDSWWFQKALSAATSALFMRRRIGFYLPDGTRPDGKPFGTALLAYGLENDLAITMSGFEGVRTLNHKFIEGKHASII